METKKKIHVRLSEQNTIRIEEMADRYGMPLNGMISFIVGSWLDNNYDIKDRVNKIVTTGSQEMTEKLLNDPKALEMMMTMMAAAFKKDDSMDRSDPPIPL